MAHDIIGEGQIALHGDGIELYSNIVTHKHGVRKVHRAVKNHVPNPDPAIKLGVTQPKIFKNQWVVLTSTFNDQTALKFTIHEVFHIPLEQAGYDRLTAHAFQVSPLSSDNTDQMLCHKYT